MKVLWFTNTSVNANLNISLKNYKGGWLQALNQPIEKEIDLHIAFLNPNGLKSFKIGETTYHSIAPSNWKVRMLKKAIFNIDPEENNLDLYLKIIESIKPDLIHIFGTEKRYIELIDKTTIPVLVSIQGVLPSIYNKYNSGFDDTILHQVKISSGLDLKSIFPVSALGEKKNFRRRALFERLNFPKIKFIDGRTDWDRRVTSLLCPQAKYFHIDRVLREDFYHTEWEEPANQIYRIHSTIGPNFFKGFETICEALFELTKIDVKVIWTVAGINEKDPIVKATKLKLRNRFPNTGLVLLGKQDSEELLNTLLESNLYVMPSHIENSPNSLAEAMILGMPCIATLAGGTGSYLKDGEDGILIQDGDALGLAGAIIELKRNTPLALEYGKAARNNALDRHNKIRIVADLLHVYRSIIDDCSHK